MMGWLQEVIGDAQEYAKPKDLPYFWDDLMTFCAPSTFVYTVEGNPVLGMISYR